jgi:hypothetical protein
MDFPLDFLIISNETFGKDIKIRFQQMLKIQYLAEK